MREKPKLKKPPFKQVHFDIEMSLFLEFEKKIYNKGIKVSDYFKNIVREEMEKND